MLTSPGVSEMSDEDDIEEEVKNEMEKIRQRIAGLEVAADKRKRAEEYWAEAMAILSGRVGMRRDGE